MAESTKEVVPDSVRTAEGDALRRLIDARGVSQQTLATTSGIGSKGFLWQVVSGHRPLNLDAAAKLAKALQVKIDDFSPRIADVVRETSALVVPAAYLREPNGDAIIDVPAPPHVARAPIPLGRGAQRDSWPFSSVTPTEFETISPESRAELDAIVRGMFIEASRRGKTRGA